MKNTRERNNQYYNSQSEIKIEKEGNIIKILQQKSMMGYIQRSDFKSDI